MISLTAQGIAEAAKGSQNQDKIEEEGEEEEEEEEEEEDVGCTPLPKSL